MFSRFRAGGCDHQRGCRSRASSAARWWRARPRAFRHTWQFPRLWLRPSPFGKQLIVPSFQLSPRRGSRSVVPSTRRRYEPAHLRQRCCESEGNAEPRERCASSWFLRLVRIPNNGTRMWAPTCVERLTEHIQRCRQKSTATCEIDLDAVTTPGGFLAKVSIGFDPSCPRTVPESSEFVVDQVSALAVDRSSSN